MLSPDEHGGPTWMPTIPLIYCGECADAERREEDERERAKTLADAARVAGGSSRLLRWTLETYPADRDEARQALAAARAWLEAYYAGERYNLWLSGTHGTGKTGLAWGLVREIAERAVRRYYDETPREDRGQIVPARALFIVWRDLLNDVKASWRWGQRADRGGVVDEDDVDPATLIDRARHVPVLCLDDLGAERPTPYALEELASLVERRWQREIPIIVTSNFSTRELAAQLGHEDPRQGKRIVSRLLDGAASFRFEGESRRLPRNL